jgi:hypothetical protein
MVFNPIEVCQGLVHLRNWRSITAGAKIQRHPVGLLVLEGSQQALAVGHGLHKDLLGE